MRKLKHLPVDDWPEADQIAFEAAFAPGDIFDGTSGPGSHLAEGTRRTIRFGYRRWLGFLAAHYPDDLSKAPADRITLDRVRAFTEHLGAGMLPTSVFNVIDNLYFAARLVAPTRDWAWLKAIKARLAARAMARDRFDRLVPSARTLDFGVELMDQALLMPTVVAKPAAIQYRDGLMLALLSLWPIRRRSLAALTVSRHIEFDESGVNILLYAADTKGKRAETFRVPMLLVPYLRRYVDDIRPRLLGRGRS